MDLKKSIEGTNNTLNVSANVSVKNSSISINGNNNNISIGDNTILNNAHFIIESNNNNIKIGKNCRITGRYIQKITDNNSIEIGNGTTFGIVHIICCEGKSVVIGEDCMFAYDISIRTTDSHAIIDKDTKKRINSPKDIIIGNHVWVAADVIILKGSVIQDNSVVGVKSLVNKKFDAPNLLISGIPAEIRRCNIDWERPLLG